MNEYPIITNNITSFISSLKDRKNRYSSRLFIAEGEKIADELSTSMLKTKYIIIKSNPSDRIIRLLKRFKTSDVYTANEKQFKKISDAVTPQDIIAVAEIPESPQQSNKSCIALDGINDPGNLGTIVRTADWFGFESIILSSNCVDPYSPKVVRSAMGSLFRMNIYVTDDLAGYLSGQLQGYSIFGATLDARSDMTIIKPTDRFCIVFGSESHGLSESVESVLTTKFKIAGRGKAESLNVAVSAGISMFHFSKYI